jgi:SAM-dependent methyltransferase
MIGNVGVPPSGLSAIANSLAVNQRQLAGLAPSFPKWSLPLETPQYAAAPLSPASLRGDRSIGRTAQASADLAHTASDLRQIYQARFGGSVDYRQSVWAVLAQYFARWISPDASVLDLGCGYCEFINQIPAGKKFAIDLNPAAVDRAAPGTTVLLQDCSEGWPISPGSLDTVFTSNFFEHLPSKSHLERTLIEAHRCLRNGGRLIAMGPNIRYVSGAYWDFLDHYPPLTELSLTEILKKCGFGVELARGRFLPYTMSGGRQYPVWGLHAYLSLPPLWRCFGKQFLVVARKAS